MKKMATKMSKILYSDIDGCVVDWFGAFKEKKLSNLEIVNPNEYYMEDMYNIPKALIEDMVREFNSSEDFKSLRPIDDSVSFIKKLCEDFGYRVVFISAFGNYNSYGNEKWIEARYSNMADIIGEKNIHDLHCVPLTETNLRKQEILEWYDDKGAIWVEDNIPNAESGVKAGYTSLLYHCNHNKKYGGNIGRVFSWEDVYKIIEKKESV